jgi:ribonuclease HII
VPRRTASRTVENAVRRLGFARVVGVDEVGRGGLAGPVVVAAVVLHPDRPIKGVRDSKLLTPAARERLYVEITERADAWTLGSASPEEVDELNVHHASLQAMRRAVNGLVPLPDFVLVDGFRIPDLFLPQRRVIGGDRRCAVIAAASIVAKVTRDRQMLELHKRDPRYGFDSHKGYATAQHLEAVARFGQSPAHRTSFRAGPRFDRIEAPADRRGRGVEGG